MHFASGLRCPRGGQLAVPGKRNFTQPLYKRGKVCYNTSAIEICASGSMDRASDSGSEGWGFESLLAYQRGVLIGLPFELFVNIFQKLHVGVQLFSVLKLWIEGLFPYYNIRRFL